MYKEYRVLERKDLASLEGEINELAQEGWILLFWDQIRSTEAIVLIFERDVVG